MSQVRVCPKLDGLRSAQWIHCSRLCLAALLVVAAARFAAGRSYAPVATLVHPSEQTDLNFGRSLAAGEGYLVVGAGRQPRRGEKGLAFKFSTIDGALVGRLGSEENTGGAVGAANGVGILVAFLDPARAILYGPGGERLLELTDPEPEANNGYGAALAVGARFLAVSAPYGSTGGKVHVFDAAAGNVARSIADPGPSQTGGFGAAVVLVNDGRLAIASPRDETFIGRAGAVHIFQVPEGATIGAIYPPEASDEASGFGTALAVLGGELFVGAPNAPHGGAVYVFDAMTFEFRRKIAPPTAEAGQSFGVALAVAPDRLLVGASGSRASSGLQSAGAAYLMDAATGIVEQEFVPPTPGGRRECTCPTGTIPCGQPEDCVIIGGPRFGTWVALVGDTVAIAAVSDLRGGTVHLFRPVEGEEQCGDGTRTASEACEPPRAGCCGDSCQPVDRDGDGQCDADDTCTGGFRSLRYAFIEIFARKPDAGARLSFDGDMAIPPAADGGLIDPRQTGVRLLLGRRCSFLPDRGCGALTGFERLSSLDYDLQVAPGAAWRRKAGKRRTAYTHVPASGPLRRVRVLSRGNGDYTVQFKARRLPLYLHTDPLVVQIVFDHDGRCVFDQGVSGDAPGTPLECSFQLGGRGKQFIRCGKG
jgi:hypothetical protein